MSNKRNYSIDIFRIICAIMVVAIHTHPFENYNLNLSYLFTQIIPRIAVLFFFCVSGYYFIKNILNDHNNFKKTFLKLLKTYLIWSLIYFIFKLGLAIKNKDKIVDIITRGVRTY